MWVVFFVILFILSVLAMVFGIVYSTTKPEKVDSNDVDKKNKVTTGLIIIAIGFVLSIISYIGIKYNMKKK